MSTRRVRTIDRLRIVLSFLSAVGPMACRSAGPSGAHGVAPPPPPDLLRSFVGQTMILRHQGDEERVAAPYRTLSNLKGDCDTIVDVASGKFDGRTVRFTLRTLGRPRLAARGAHQEHCAHDRVQVELTASGFPPDASSENLDDALGQVLQSPETYLRAHGITFDLKQASTPPTAVAERLLTAGPERLLWGDAAQHDPTRRIRHEGEVEIEGVVGVDGRLYDPRVLTPLSSEQVASVRRVLPIWRFQPGRRGPEPAAVVVRQKLVFRIYY